MNNNIKSQRIEFITNEIIENDDDDTDDLWNRPRTSLLNTKIPSSLPSSASPSSGGSSGTLSKLNSLDCWDYSIELECLQGPQDLQLAAELGKNLLVRNKELETELRNHQNIIDDQAQEIEYLQKQTAALREVTDSRFQIYEHMEVGIQDLERVNHRLKIENANDKKTIKSLMNTNETLELRNDEINKNLEEIKKLLSIEKRRNESLLAERNGYNDEEAAMKSRWDNDDSQRGNYHGGDSYDDNFKSTESCGFSYFSSSSGVDNKPPISQPEIANSTSVSDNFNLSESLNFSHILNEENEEMLRFVTEFESIKKECVREQQRNSELEEHITVLVEENHKLQNQIAQSSTNEEMKSVHEELSILDEVRQGQMCTRCLRSIDDRTTINLDETSSIAPTEDDDDRSLLDLDDGQNYRSAAAAITIKKPNNLDLHSDCPSPNPYRELVEKYEALLEVQRQQSNTVLRNNNDGAKSLAEEFANVENDSKDDKITEKNSSSKKSVHSADGSCRRTPTEFSETETSSSGFSDETSNKGTQTDGRPGFFLCSIGDGEDCKFSIYDDVSPIDSRFRQRPEYRELFKEIFGVLRKAAEKKEEGEKLPLLDDTNPVINPIQQHKVPPVTPANEELPDFGDDTQSIISSVMSEQSVAMSECITKIERKIAKKHIIEKNQENQPPSNSASILSVNENDNFPANSSKSTKPKTNTQIIENGRILTPLKREPLDYLAVGVGLKKKNRKKNRNYNADRSDSPVLPSPPRVYLNSGNKKRRDMRPLNPVSPLLGTTTNPPNRGGWGNQSRPGGGNEWNGNSMIIYNRNHSDMPTTSNGKSKNIDLNSIQYSRSTISQDLHKLKKLDLSYAEVLRRTDICKHHRKK